MYGKYLFYNLKKAGQNWNRKNESPDVPFDIFSSLKLLIARSVLAALIGLLLSYSCTTPVYMNRTLPPQITLESQPARIIFMNHFNYQNNASTKEKHETAYKTGIEEFALALVNFEAPENPMAVITLDSLTCKSQNDTICPKPDISSLCRSNNAEFLLSLDSLCYYFNNEVIREENDDGSVSKTKDFYLTSLYYLTLYDTAGNAMDKTYIENSTYYSSRPTLGALITFRPNLAKAIDKITLLARESGSDYMGQFYPSFERNVMRNLYTGKTFSEANSLIKSGNYNEAIIRLQELTITLKPKLAEKAQHNLEVAIELKENNVATGF